MHFGFIESRKKPKKRTYEEYIENGTTAIATKSPCNGVKGIWKFHSLPYASDIAWTVDAMHAHNMWFVTCCQVLDQQIVEILNYLNTKIEIDMKK